MQNTPLSMSKQSCLRSSTHRKTLLISVCCLLFLFFLSSNSTLAASTAAPLAVNGLQIQLQTRPGGPVIHINNPTLITSLYRKMYQLPVYPQGRTCEEFRQGDVYSLMFSFNKRIIVYASVEKNGCHGLILSPWDTRQPDQIFWNLFNQALNGGYSHVYPFPKSVNLWNESGQTTFIPPMHLFTLHFVVPKPSNFS